MYSEGYMKMMRGRGKGGRKARVRPVSLRPRTPASHNSGGGPRYGSYHDTPHTMGMEDARSTGYGDSEYAAASPEMGFVTKGPNLRGSSY